MKRRLFLIEKIKDSNTIGLVIAATGVKDFRKAIGRVRSLCKINNKRLYVLSVGKVGDYVSSDYASSLLAKTIEGYF